MTRKFVSASRKPFFIASSIVGTAATSFRTAVVRQGQRQWQQAVLGEVITVIMVWVQTKFRPWPALSAILLPTGSVCRGSTAEEISHADFCTDDIYELHLFKYTAAGIRYTHKYKYKVELQVKSTSIGTSTGTSTGTRTDTDTCTCTSARAARLYIIGRRGVPNSGCFSIRRCRFCAQYSAASWPTCPSKLPLSSTPTHTRTTQAKWESDGGWCVNWSGSECA